MFDSASAFNQDIGGWAVHSVTSMYAMFYLASSFNQDIGNWAVDSVTSMDAMFFSASAFDQDIGNWAVDSVNSMSQMFYSASAFDQDIGWCVDDDVSLLYAFYNTPCASTSCGVVQVADVAECQTPAPSTTFAPTTFTPAPAIGPLDAAPAVTPLHALLGAALLLLVL